MNTNIKTFDCGGFSLHNGNIKARVANGLAKRVSTLKYYGHEDIHFVMLPTTMSKADAIKWLMDNKEWVYANAHEHMSAAFSAQQSKRAERKMRKTGSDNNLENMHGVDSETLVDTHIDTDELTELLLTV